MLRDKLEECTVVEDGEKKGGEQKERKEKELVNYKEEKEEREELEVLKREVSHKKRMKSIYKRTMEVAM